jgi:hypothetical protein
MNWIRKCENPIFWLPRIVGWTLWPAFRSVFRPISGEIEEFRKPSFLASPQLNEISSGTVAAQLALKNLTNRLLAKRSHSIPPARRAHIPTGEAFQGYYSKYFIWH